MADEERRVSETGGAKGVKLARFDLIPWTIVREVAEHFGRGARKYDERNWERGYKWSYSFAALHRHLEAFWQGDEIDDDPTLYENGELHTARHIVAVAWHALCLAYFSRYRVGEDDRPKFPITDRLAPRVPSAMGLSVDSELARAAGIQRGGQTDSPVWTDPR